ncbi:MAG: type I-MYXAN CRISPR-associated protein Cas6/Cmx6 [Sulfuricaulis sp.]|uniref:type I-MYXAN CRISPR-associated protein Cas6/Cmx6 n=1 Tax=Sulfuricaulis sp. TaxID=2003553 RepID=UPI0025F28B1C|nr:type I-MYXAN CRISPR-associated protein Cas6/Cmx6 [Sulfuricaulis sp.]MCR4345840.1 type I-MYXAN CRISPR-associated protein Cas6/Cmx6 [Sulfuricaulis sp.]
MFWQEAKDNERYIVPDDIVDLVFSIQCRTLPVDHSYSLSQAISKALPWFAAEAHAGLHTIHGAESGNGWMRPEDPNALLHLSRRTKLMLRLPKQRIEDACKLTGQTLDIGGNSMQVGKAVVKPLSPITTLFSRYIVASESLDETAFMREAQSLLANIGVNPIKMLCGIERVISTPARKIRTRSLMLADLAVEESVRLQQRGLGPERTLGCGLFLPHKDIHEVRPDLD